MSEELNSVCESPKLQRVIRLDSVPVNQANFTEEGYLVDRPILTTTGIFEYTNPDGSTRRELRLPDEVFDEESLKSYKGKPIVITHDAGLITKNNVGEEQIGTILSDGYKDRDSVRAEIVIHDTNEMKRSGLKELSLGYNLELDETPGIWNGEKYDAIQRDIRINHLALVREARAGDNARLNIDSRDTNVLKGGIVMTASKKRKHTARADGILSKEDLEAKIAEYKKRHHKDACNKDADVPEVETAETMVKEVAEDSHDDTIPSYTKGDLSPKINKCLLNRDERDEKGDPVDMDEAMEYIAEQDEDLQTLFDIIDTLLAERDFGGDKKADADEPVEEEVAVESEEVEEDGDEEDDDPFADLDKEDADDEDVEEVEELLEKEEDSADEEDVEFEDEEVEEDEDDVPEEDEVTEDLIDEEEDGEDEEEEISEEEIEEDADDDEEVVEEEEEFEDDEDDVDPDNDLFKKPKGVVNADSVDAIVRTRVKIGMVGRSLNMDGLENKGIRGAMRAIIRKVRPTMRLDGKSDTYIRAAFDMACDEVKRSEKAPKGVDYQRRQMYNRKSIRNDSKETGGAEAARERMIKNMKIKKEDK